MSLPDRHAGCAQVYKGVAYDPFDMHVWQLHAAAVHAYDKFFG